MGPGTREGAWHFVRISRHSARNFSTLDSTENKIKVIKSSIYSSTLRVELRVASPFFVCGVTNPLKRELDQPCSQSESGVANSIARGKMSTAAVTAARPPQGSKKRSLALLVGAAAQRKTFSSDE